VKITMYREVGDFGEDKDAAAILRETKIKPALVSKESVILDFEHVTLVTQSFIHALISDVLRTSGETVLDSIEFKHCAPVVRGIISTVVQYSLDSMSESLSSEEQDDGAKLTPHPAEKQKSRINLEPNKKSVPKMVTRSARVKRRR
jgi:STAS-like domain of unknown function (DUF4325)